jgi:hypothetical protein
MGTGDASKRVVISDGERVVAEHFGLQHHFVDMAGAAEERVIGADP